MNSGIYKILNKINGKYYIGSAKNFNIRWNSHKYYLKNNKHYNIYLQRAWNKNWGQNFEFLIIEYCEINKLEEKEQYWIDLTECCNREKGYNICKIAGGSPMAGRTFTEEHKRKLSISNTGVIRSEETRQKLRERVITDEWRKNSSLGNIGRKHNQIAKDKVSEALRKRIRHIKRLMKKLE